MEHNGNTPFMIQVEFFTTALLWGMVPLVMQWSSQDLHAGTFTLVRFGLAALFLLLILKGMHKKIGIPHHQAAKIILLSCITMFPFSYLFLLGIKHTHISIAGMIQGTSPALTVLCSLFIFKQKPSKTVILGIVITYLGLLFFFIFAEHSREATNTLWLGAVYIGVSIVFFALYTTLGKPILAGLDPWVSTLYVCIGVCCTGLPVFFMEHYTMPPQHMTLAGMSGTFYMAFFASVICLFLYSRCMHTLGATRASLITNVVPIFVVLSGNLILDEPLNGLQIAFLCITLIGVYVTIQPKSMQRLHETATQE